MIQLFKDKKYWKEMGIILLLGIVINVACFFMCSMTGHCANQQTFDPSEMIIPYSIPDMMIFNPSFDASAFQTQWETNIGPMMYNWYGGQISITDYIVSIREYDQNNNRWYIDLVCHPSIASGINLDHNFSQGIFVSGYWFGFTVSAVDYSYIGNLSAGVSGHTFLGGHTSITIGDVTYLANYPVLLGGGDLYSGDTLVFTNEVLGGSINVGDYTDLPPLDEILNNLTDSYTPDFSPVYPNIDNNKTDLENQQSFFDTLSQGITQNFNNLGANLQKFFNKIQQKLTNVSNSISTNLHNGFATLMQNIRDFFGPKLDKIIELLEQLKNGDTQESFDEKWNNSQLGQDIDSMSQAVDNCFNVWRDLQEPKEFKIPFHIEYVPMFNVDECQYIDLGLFSPVFPYIRTIMWAFLVYSLMYTIIDSLANYIGGGDE